MSLKSILLTMRIHNIQPLVIWLIAFKTLYLTSVILAVWLWGDLDIGNYYQAMVRWPREGNPSLASHFATWDAAHYLLLSEAGYEKHFSSCAFYPLWPLLNNILSVISGSNHLTVGILLSNILSLTAFVLYYNNVCETYSRQIANISLILLITFPGSLFYHFNYSESLFLFLLMILWKSMKRKQYNVACMTAFLLPMTRAIGVLCIVPIVCYIIIRKPPSLLTYVLQALSYILGRSLTYDNGNKKTPNSINVSSHIQRTEVLSHEESWLLLCAPLIGWVCYLAFMWISTGNSFEGFEAQKFWGVHSISNIWDIHKFILGLIHPTAWHDFRGSILDRCVFILLMLCLPVIWRLNSGLICWTCVLGVVPAMSGTFTSFTRFASLVFPMFIALGVVLSKPGRQAIRFFVLVLFIAIHIMLLWRFVNFKWAG